jgi:hypothetical protein
LKDFNSDYSSEEENLSLHFVQFDSSELVILDDVGRLLEVEKLWKSFRIWLKRTPPKVIVISTNELAALPSKDFFEPSALTVQFSMPNLTYMDRKSLFSFFFAPLILSQNELSFLEEIPKVGFLNFN